MCMYTSDATAFQHAVRNSAVERQWKAYTCLSCQVTEGTHCSLVTVIVPLQRVNIRGVYSSL